MKKVYKLEDLDCANCANKMEIAIRQIKHINEVTINFMAQKMIIDIDDDYFDTTMKLVIKTLKKVEPDCSMIR